MGELVAWIIGWDLVLEYAVGAATVATSWSRYLNSLLLDFHLALPPRLIASPFETVRLADGTAATGLVNVPAIFVIALMSLLLMRGISESARVNNVIVVIKVAIVVAVIGFGVSYIDTANYRPFVPPNQGGFGHFGWSGVLRGAGTVFFAFIGFDAVSTAAEETKNPQRIGILGALAICTVLYVAFSLVLTGIVNYRDMVNDAAPVATAINHTPYVWLHLLVKVGILMGYTSVILVLLLGQSRVFYAMSRDGLLPPFFSAVHHAWRTPWRCNALFMVFSGALAGFLPISTLGNMTSIGTLLAFVIVCIGVIVLRRRDRTRTRDFRVPGVPVVPILGILSCVAMMIGLDILTWIRLVIGLAVYFGWSRNNVRKTRAA